MKKIKTFIVKEIVRLSSYIFKNTKYQQKKNGLVKVNLGCGLQCLSDWINIDGSLTALFGSTKLPIVNKLLYKFAGASNYYTFDFYNKVIIDNSLKFYDLKNGVPLESNSTDVIYCSHFLEHLTKVDGRHFLQECYRSLKTGGLLRIAVPDLDIAMQIYQAGEVEKMQDLFFFTSSEWDFAAHKYNYNFTFLKEILEKIGFNNVSKKNYREGDCPDIGYLDVYPEHSLYVECRK